MTTHEKSSPDKPDRVGSHQIAIVLGSVSIVALSQPLLVFALSLGAIATVLMINGFFLFFNLPIVG